MTLKIFVIAIVCAGACFAQQGRYCDTPQYFDDVRIPMGYTLTMNDFINYVAGTPLKEAYVLLTDPAPFSVNTNYNCEITQIDSTTFQRVCFGLDPNCTVYNFTLTSATQGPRISFSYTDPDNAVVTDYYWSPCPSKYILRLQCPSSSIQQNNKCAITGARITVFLVGDVDLSNAPWYDISHAIFTATGVMFGDINGMAWYFTENTGAPCVI